jgi:hypothetical protein
MALEIFEVRCNCDKNELLKFEIDVEDSLKNHTVLKECYKCISKHQRDKGFEQEFILHKKSPPEKTYLGKRK